MPTQSIFLTGTMIGNQKQKRRILILSNEQKKNVVYEDKYFVSVGHFFCVHWIKLISFLAYSSCQDTKMISKEIKKYRRVVEKYDEKKLSTFFFQSYFF
jgi:hypothetical protein